MENGKNNDEPRRRKGINKSKKIFLTILIIAIVIGMIVGSYNYYSYYSSKKCLEKARAYVGIGEYDKAIETYKKYLLKNPDATAAKLALASILLETKEEAQAIEILNIVHFEAKSKNMPELQKNAYVLLTYAYGQVANRLKEEADKALEDKDYRLARNKYKMESFYLKKNLSVSIESKQAFKTNVADTTSQAYFETLLRYSDLFSSIANISLTYWLEGESEKANETISENFYLKYMLHIGDADIPKAIYSLFAEKLYKIGSEAFGKKDYKTARKHWQGALENYRQDNSQIAKEWIPRVQYDIAITYYNEANYWKAKELLTQLQENFPEYESTEVKNLYEYKFSSFSPP